MDTRPQASITTFVVVDDNKAFRRILRGIVEDHPQWLVLAEGCNGLEAVELARAHSPDIMLIDVVMPVMNGIQAVKQIKQSNPSTRIIVFSVYHEEEFRLEGLQAGAEYFVWKEELNGKSLAQMINPYSPRIETDRG